MVHLSVVGIETDHEVIITVADLDLTTPCICAFVALSLAEGTRQLVVGRRTDRISE